MRETLVKSEEFKDSPVGRIPKDWQIFQLSEIIEGVIDFRGKTPKKIGMEWGNGEIPALSANNVEMGRINFNKETYYGSEKLYQKWMNKGDTAKGDVILTTEAPLGNIAQIPDNRKYILSQRVLLLKTKFELVFNNFLKYYLMSDCFQSALRKNSTGTTATGIQQAKLVKISVILPPIQEQQIIAEVLENIDKTIAHTSSLIAKLKLMKAGLLHDLLTRGLDENGELRDAIGHPEQFKDSPLGRIPKDWEVVKLVDHISLPNGQLDPKQQPYCNWVLIAPDHIESETGRILNLQTAAEQNAISGKYGFQLGDVLYSKIRPYLRKAVLADREGLCSADMYPLRPEPTIVSRFLLALILGEDFSRFATAVSMRSGFPKINREELSGYQLALPTYKEQQRIAEILDTYDTRIRTEEAYRDKLKLQKKGLMHDLLTGKVRVKDADKFTPASDTV
jgi:type I restriction enzyme S subunit